nr:hypothetical protein [Candidatus Woesearchaeota archaeon]
MDYDDILKKYDTKLKEKIDSDSFVLSDRAFSREYEIFRNELLNVNERMYEKFAKFFGKFLDIRPKEKDYEKLKDSIRITHLHISPEDATAFGIISGLGIILIGILVFVLNLFLAGKLLFMLPTIFVLAGAFLIKPISYMPNYFANKWRLEASNQMVLCILYVVIYMRHTSNLEHAIKFAGEHVGMPLSLDLRKIFWDVETGKYSTIKESLDLYLENWREYNLEFVEAFHLIEGSLYEASEERRVELLDKSLEIMLQGTYEKMLHFAQELKTPITMLHMLGIILPILGLVIFPLIASFLQGAVKWYHLAILYNLIFPIGVYMFGMSILSKRPTGYGESNILRTNPELNENDIKPFFLGMIITMIFLFIGFLPIILHFTNPQLDQASFLEGSPIGGKLLDYKCSLENGAETCIGPFGIGALILSLFIPFGIALGISFYYRMKTKDLMEIQKNTSKLESEFAGSLFQLGNRVGDGIPVEIAFSDVAENMRGTPSGNFFSQVSLNIRRLGVDVKRAIFDSQFGAALLYPSNLIESSMKVLIESARKGPQIVAKSMIAISVYVDRIHNVNERLKDILSDVLSSMKSQISFLAPMIAGIVVGVGSMVTTVINKLNEQFSNVQFGEIGNAEGTGVGNVGALADILRIEHVVPSFHFQLIVGLYVVEVIIILTILSNLIENGFDKLTRNYHISKNLLFGTSLYIIISLIGILIFNVLASGISFVTGA